MPRSIGICVAAFVSLSVALYIVQFPARFSDFRAFYCSGQAIREHADPYREHPLHECEHALASPVLSPLNSEITIPAPFPGFVLAIFALMSLLPFSCAALLWTLGSSVAIAFAVVFVARITSTSIIATAIVILFPAMLVPLPLGQPTPLILLAIVGCAALLRANRPRLAAMMIFGTMLDPHVTLAVWLGVFVGVPRTRAVLLAGTTMLVGIGLFASGPALEWEYVRAVVPAHALANVPEFSQFSTANFAFMAGVPMSSALMIGNAWYVASLAIGNVVALRLRNTLGAATIALIPPAFAVFGGSHTHFQQLALAVPAFLLACSAAHGARRIVLVTTTFVAAVPWLLLAPFPILFLPVALMGTAFARRMNVVRISTPLGLGSFWLALLLCWSVAVSAKGYIPFKQITTGNPLAEVAWSHFVAVRGVPPELWVYLAKIPTIVAFLSVFAVLVKMSITAPINAEQN